MQIYVHSDNNKHVPYWMRYTLERRGMLSKDPDCDVVLNIDSIHEVGIKQGRKKTLYWEVDDFMMLGKNTDWYNKCDFVYILHKEHLPYYPSNTKVLPVAADPMAFYRHDVPQDFEYSFIASLEDLPVYRFRIAMIDKLLKRSRDIGQKILISNGWGDEYVKLLSRGRIRLDILPVDDQNRSCVHMRLFESIAVGCTMVIDHPYIWQYFEKNVHLMGMDKFGITDTEEIERVGKAGRDLIIEKHTWDHRLDSIIQDIT